MNMLRMIQERSPVQSCRVLISVAVFIFLFASPSMAKEWYEGGTLHKATGGEWQRATEPNRLATSADFVAAAKAASDMKQLRKRAEAVKSCVTEATDDPDLYSLKVSEVAASCIILLGYR